MHLRNALLALLFAGITQAETTIVPLRGDIVFGSDGSYFTIVAVTNVSAVPVTVRRGEVFPAVAEECGAPIAVVIQPLATAEVPTGCKGLYAYTLQSDGPVRVDTTITTLRPVQLPVGNTSSFHHQQVPAAHEWLPAQRISIIPRVNISPGEGARTNLFVTNPGDHELTFDLRVTSLSPSFPFRDQRHFIQPRTTAVIRLASVEDPICEVPVICGVEHKLTFTANAPYLASASSIDYDKGDAVFFTGSPTEN
jgi:hypothetical protein